MIDHFENSASISLYFELPHNQAVALDVIARSTIAWDSLIKELASVAAPSDEIHIDFLSGTIGSRSINSIIRTTAKVAIDNPWTAGSLSALAGVFLLAPPAHIASDLTNHLAKEWFGHEDSVLVDGDIDRVATRVVELQRDRDAMRLKQQIFQEANKDERIRGLGALPKIAKPPTSLIIPRADFEEHGAAVDNEQAVETRTLTRNNQRVTIVRPYSKGEERRWKFEDKRGEFSATMRDPIFLEALRARHTELEIGEGVEMWLDLRVKEELVDGEWEEKEIDVVKVVRPNVDLQSSFKLAPDEPNKPDG
ncbi:hypothetical protein [Parasphingorhabdus sp.]|uniref:hypothetical protein n=1 Tax=Parasphingorhabdus sp. TaxID=2709688 RepID=UPI002F921798